MGSGHVLAAGCAILAACAALRSCTRPEAVRAQGEPGERISLPAPSRGGRVSLEEALARRRSVREFTAQPLSVAELGQLLWAAQGITRRDGLRTAPSAGALYPLEIYVVTGKGTFHYEPQGHQLQRRAQADLRGELAGAALSQECVREAAAVFVIAAEYQRTARKYGAGRSPRYVHLEAGHAAQNLLLQAAALELGGVPVGAFHDGQVKKALALPENEDPVYLVAVGHPR